MNGFALRSALIIVFAAALSIRAKGGPSNNSELGWDELGRMPLPAPGIRIPYGAAPQQWGELRLPTGTEPPPVIMMIHGGCWQAEYSSSYFSRLAAWLTGRGYATWTIEYRRIGDPGGGWPGTFLDVASAADKLRDVAREHPIDLDRTYAAGHSAGGQLALWLASRERFKRGDTLFSENPIKLRGVLGLAAITDLYSYRVGPADSCHGSVAQLLGGNPRTVAARFAATSPLQRLPLGVPQIFIQGEHDAIVEPASVRKYVEAAQRGGDQATFIPLAGAGHFETSVPLPATEPALIEAMRLLSAPR